MRRPPGAGKDIVAQVINYLRQNHSVAILSSPILAKEWGCDQSNVRWDIRRLISCGIIRPIDRWGSGHRNTRFQLASEFREGDGWRDVLLNHAPLIVHKRSVPGEKNTAAMAIIDHLRANGGRAVINGVVLAKQTGFSQPAISYALKTLIKKGLVTSTGPTGTGIRNPEFVLTEKGKSCATSELPQKLQTRSTQNSTSRVGNNDTALKLSISRELVQVYEELSKTQDLATRLQTENAKLQGKVTELQEELESERSSHRHEANEIAQLELQLRELRQESTKGARRLIFDHRGVQA